MMTASLLAYDIVYGLGSADDYSLVDILAARASLAADIDRDDDDNDYTEHDLARIDLVVKQRRALILASATDPMRRAIGSERSYGCTDWPSDADRRAAASRARADRRTLPMTIRLPICRDEHSAVEHLLVSGRGQVVSGPLYWSNAAVGQSGWRWVMVMTKATKATSATIEID